MGKLNQDLSDKISFPEIKIGQGDNFGNDSDRFKQTDYAQTLLHRADGIEDGNNVILLHGAWGTGKSIFIDRWCNMAKDKDYRVAYIDAFSADYISDPFVLIAAEINKQILADTDEIKKNDYLKKAKEIGVALATSAISAGTNGAIDLESIRNSIKDEFSEDANSIARTKEFTQCLADIANAGKKIIITIDELDRCRPDFALRVLERIKHIFGVHNVVFIIVADRYRLSDMVRHEYGYNNKNANLYLNKFF